MRQEERDMYDALAYHPILRDQDVALFGMMRTKLMAQDKRIKELQNVELAYVSLLEKYDAIAAKAYNLEDRVEVLNEFDRYDILEFDE